MLSSIFSRFKTWYAQPFAPYILILALSALVYIPFIGTVHLFDWDEINFAEASREMILTGDYFRARIDFEPFWEKPPLFFWMQVLCMKIFGINEFSARLPNALAGICTLCFLFFVGTQHFTRRFAELWVLLHGTTILPFFYFKSGIIDPWFNLFMVIGLYFLLCDLLPSTNHEQSPQRGFILWRNSILAGLAIGLAILTKGPTGALLPGLAFILVLAVSGAYQEYRFMRIGVVAVVAFIVCGAWFGVDVAKNGPWFLVEFFQYQIRLFSTGDAGHSQPFYYHFVVVFIGCFPSAQIALDVRAIRSQQNNVEKVFDTGFVLLLCVVLVLFSIVQTKIVHYSSLAYFPVCYFGARALYSRYTMAIIHTDSSDNVNSTELSSSIFPLYVRSLVMSVGVLWALLLTAICLIGLNAQWLMPYIRDEFVRGNLSMPVTWSYRSLIPGIGLLISILAAGTLLRTKPHRAVVDITGALVIALTLFLQSSAPKIETYTQGAPIAFYQSLKGEDCYVLPLGYKSYAHLFYSDKQQRNSPQALGIHRDHFEQWLLEGEIDKPAYFVCKAPSANDYRSNINLEEIKTEGGFTFFRRRHFYRKRDVAGITIPHALRP